MRGGVRGHASRPAAADHLPRARRVPDRRGDASGDRRPDRKQHGRRTRLDRRDHFAGLLPGAGRAPLPRQPRRGRQGAARPLHRPPLRHLHRRGKILGDRSCGLEVCRFARTPLSVLSRLPRAARRAGAGRRGLDPRRVRAPRGTALRARLERLLDRDRIDRALPPRAESGKGAFHDLLDPRQLRAHADRRPELRDGRDLRVRRRAEELHQRLDRDVLHLRDRHRRPQVRASDHDRRAALGRTWRVDPVRGDVVGQGLQAGDPRDGVHRDVCRPSDAVWIRAPEGRRKGPDAAGARLGRRHPPKGEADQVVLSRPDGSRRPRTTEN
ncbi:MAG: hypothetical protein LC796_03650 [Acidobacteria bacterium]|nr:hypothetical protein [Acidobacteriota bacterium]